MKWCPYRMLVSQEQLHLLLQIACSRNSFLFFCENSVGSTLEIFIFFFLRVACVFFVLESDVTHNLQRD